jgi:hypothetical protein
MLLAVKLAVKFYPCCCFELFDVLLLLLLMFHEVSDVSDPAPI